MKDTYTGLSKEYFAIIQSRDEKFKDALNDPSKNPVKVFDPLSPKRMEELFLIRKISKDLQIKKEEDLNKAAQAAAVEKSEEAKKDVKNEKIDENKSD